MSNLAMSMLTIVKCRGRLQMITVQQKSHVLIFIQKLPRNKSCLATGVA